MRRSKDEARGIVYEILAKEWRNWAELALRAEEKRMSTATLSFYLKEAAMMHLVEKEIIDGFPSRSRYRLLPPGEQAKGTIIMQKMMNMDKLLRQLETSPKERISNADLSGYLNYAASLLPIILWTAKAAAEDPHNSLDLQLSLNIVPIMHMLIDRVDSVNSEAFLKSFHTDMITKIDFMLRS